MRKTIQTAVLSFLLLLALGAAGPLTAPLAAQSGGSPPAPDSSLAPIFGLDEVERGQRGYGLSVFAGTEPERFDVEVLGVLGNLQPGVSYIMARLTGQGLERSGVAAGMSGSPVYIDDRLAGAVAFSWPFSHEAIAGITPIAYMRAIPDAPAGTPAAGASALAEGAVTTLDDLVRLASVDLPEGLLEKELSRLRAPTPGDAVPALHWMAGGFGEKTAALLSRALGSVGMGSAGTAGSMSSGGPSPGPAAASAVSAASGNGGNEAPGLHYAPGFTYGEMVPGGMLTAVLMDGDLRLAAAATITEVIGDRILAFGHPFLGAGPVEIPMAEAEVITVISSMNNSFKLTNVGKVIGTFDEDRRPGVQGHVGRISPMIPMRVLIEGPDRTETYEMRIADVPTFIPAMVGTGVLGSLEAASWRAGDQSIDVEASFDIAGYEPLKARQSFDGPAAATEAATYLITLAAYLYQNDLEEVKMKGLDVKVKQRGEPLTATLVDAHAERTRVKPGEVVEVNLDLVAWRGESYRHSVTVELPEEVPAGRYSLLIGDGASIDAARLAVEPADPVSFHQALEMLGSFHSRRELVVLGVFSSRGLAVAGEVMPRLPGSMLSLWGPTPSGSARTLRLAVAQQQEEAFPVPLSGIVRVDLEVERREPVTRRRGAAAGGPPVGEGGGEGPDESPATMEDLEEELPEREGR